MKKEHQIKIENYEKPIRELIGKSISIVNYYEIDYGEPLWNETEYHSLGFGIEFTTSENESCYFVWGSEFTQYNLKFKKGDILTVFSAENNAKKYNASENEHWTELIGVRITGIKSSWSYWNLVGDKKRNYYPQDIEIEFKNGKKIWISALEIRDGKPMGMQDHLTVFFDKKIANKYKTGINNVW